MSKQTVAFIGLGLMGRPMALHLRKNGYHVRVFNRNPAKTAGFDEVGATVCSTPAQAAQGAQIVFTCVGDGPDVREVLLGDNGAATYADNGTIFVDHSTISPLAARELADALIERNYYFIDAPITGGQVGAESGKLSIMCGGERGAFEKAQPAMFSYAKKITYIGGSGSGQIAKACNQILCVTTILGVAEALSLAGQLGADRAKVFEAVSGGAGHSWSLETYGPKILKGDDSPGFIVRHQQKDLRIVLELAREAGMALPGTALIHELYKLVQARGGDEKGNHTLYRAYQIMAGNE